MIVFANVPCRSSKTGCEIIGPARFHRQPSSSHAALEDVDSLPGFRRGPPRGSQTLAIGNRADMEETPAINARTLPSMAVHDRPLPASGDRPTPAIQDRQPPHHDTVESPDQKGALGCLADERKQTVPAEAGTGNSSALSLTERVQAKLLAIKAEGPQTKRPAAKCKTAPNKRVVGKAKAKPKGKTNAKTKKSDPVIDDSMVYQPADKFKTPRFYKGKTIYTDMGRKVWRLKKGCGRRDDAKFSFASDPREAWARLVKAAKQEY